VRTRPRLKPLCLKRLIKSAAQFTGKTLIGRDKNEIVAGIEQRIGDFNERINHRESVTQADLERA